MMLTLSPKSVALAGTLCAFFALPLRSQSGGFGLYEVSAPNAGEAYAGQSAVASDASTAFHNPAGMTRLWRDTWRAGVGMRYRIRPKLSLQAGASYDSSPISDWNRTPDIPVGRQRRIAVGARYALARSMALGITYTDLDLGSSRISHLQDPLAGSLAGTYSPARLRFLAFTLTVSPEE